jgi:uncharacterized protein (DUF305 family)
MNKTMGIAIISLIAGGIVGFTISSPKDNNYENMNHSMSMESMMMYMNAELVGKTGDEFDKAFLEQMIMHHQGAVEMAELALVNAKRQEIKDLSTAIIEAQNTEIGQMKNWQKSW